MKRWLLGLTACLIPLCSYAFYPDSAHVMGYTRAWDATGQYGGNRITVRDSQGYIHAVYSYNEGLPYADSAEIFYVYSTDDGVTWSTPENVSHTDSSTANEPNLVIDSNDRLHCVWKQHYDDTTTAFQDYDLYYSQNAGSGWTAPVNISNQNYGHQGCYSSMVVDSRDYVHVVWDMDIGFSGDWDVYYSFYNDTVWSAPYMISTSPYDDAFPSMAIDSSGHLHVAWRQRTTNAPIFYSMYDGNSWSSPEIIASFPGGQSSMPCVVINTDAYARVVWEWGDFPVDSGDIYYTAFDGSAWSVPMNISNTVNVSNHPSMTIDSQDNIYVVWCEKTPTIYQEVFYRTFNGATWSGIINLTQDTALSWCPKLGNPVHGNKVDLVWVNSWSGVRSVVYLALKQLGVKEYKNLNAGHGRNILDVCPNPFLQQAEIIIRSCVNKNRPTMYIYNSTGRMIKFFSYVEYKNNGEYSVVWAGDDHCGVEVPAGIYFVQLKGCDCTLTGKIIKLE